MTHKLITIIKWGIWLFLNFFFTKTIAQSAFVENKGQWNKQVKFRYTLSIGSLFAENNGITYNLVNTNDIKISRAHHAYQNPNIPKYIRFHAYKMSFVNANHVIPQGEEPYNDYENFYIGNDPHKWVSKARRYRKIIWNNIYQNIDYVLYINDQQSLQYDFVVNPGGVAENIRLKYEGQDTLMIDKNGKVIVVTSVAQINELQPYAYQWIDGQKVPVKCNFLIRNGYLAFQFPEGYNENYTLTIDPVLVFSSYSGSTADNWGFTATYDELGNGYSAGIVFNTGYPTTLGAYQVNYAGGEPANPQNPGYYGIGCDIGIIKYSQNGLQRLWATYLGGAVSEELPHSMVCNRSNDLIVMGTTGSSDFPTTANAYDNTFNGGDTTIYDNVIRFSNGTDIFISRLSSDGTQLLASTLIGGSKNDGLNYFGYYMNENIDTSLYYNYADGARGEVICDAAGNIYVGTCTFSPDFPTTQNSFGPSFHGRQEGVVFKFDPNLSQLLWSGYFGGSSKDAIYSLDIDQNNEVYIAGGTTSLNIPTTSGVWQPLAPGIDKCNGFVAHIDASGSNIIASTYVGSTEYDQVYFVRVDRSRNVYITGQTKAPGNTFIINAAYNRPNSGQFISKLPNSLASPIWSTAFGTGNGKPNISFTAFSVDLCNRIYLSGWGRNWNFTANEGTYGMDVTPNAYQTQTDGMDFYLMVLADDASHLEYATFFGEIHPNGSNAYCGHDHVDGGTSRFDKRGNIYQSVCASCGFGCNGFPTYPNPGVWSPNNGGIATPSEWVCNNALFKFSFALPLTIADFQAPTVCVNSPTHFTNTSQLATEYYWDFGDGNQSTEVNPTHTYTQPGTYYVTLIANNPTSCNIADTIIRPIVVESIQIQTNDTSICFGNSVTLTASAIGNSFPLTYVWDDQFPIQDTLNNAITNPNLTISPQQNQNYFIVVSDGICTVHDTVHVEVNKVIIQAQPDTTICPNSTATIQANVIFSTGTVSYQWNPSSSIVSGANTNSPLVNPQQSTTYTVTASESHGCTFVDSVRVNIDPFTAQFSFIQPILCHNICNGELQVTVTDPFLPVNYNWSNSDTSAHQQNLCEGTYTVTVTDALGCSVMLTETFTNPPLLEASIQVLSPAQCDSIHPNTGSIGTQVWGGTPGYHYHWNTNDTIPLLQNLFAGSYSVTITDSNGCDTVLSTVINDPSPLQIATSQQPTTCFGSCDGVAQVYITTEGSPPYSYIWNTQSSSTIIHDLCSGVYSVTVTDAEYCVRVQSVWVQQPDSIRPILNIPAIKCYGDTTSIFITQVLGGSPSYSFLWNNGDTTTAIHGIGSGVYTVIITDSHLCKDTTHINVVQPSLLDAGVNITNTLCSESCNGSINISPHGGTLPYSFVWSNGSHSQNIQNLCEGNYEITITDGNGCTYTAQYNVLNNQYSPPLNALAQPYVIYRGQNSHLYAVANSNLHFTWWPAHSLSSGYVQNPIASPDSTTAYIVQITDAYGCTNIDTVVVTVLDVICAEPYIYVPNAFTPNDDGINDILYVHADMATDLYFAIYDRWGEKIFETTDASKGWDGKYKGKPLDPAVFVYYLKVTCLNRLQFEKKGNITLIR
ncbi:MAG: DUF7948 domain-containing protein [Bacteroidales bacterium]